MADSANKSFQFVIHCRAKLVLLLHFLSHALLVISECLNPGNKMFISQALK